MICKNLWGIVMNLENMIKQQALQLKSTRRNIDIAPDISAEVLNKWEKKYNLVLGEGIREYVLVMSYTKTGNFALTGDAMYYDNYLQDGMQILSYVDVAEVSFKTGGLFTTDKVFIKRKNGEELCLDGCIDGINIEKFVGIFNEIIRYAKQWELTVSKQDVPLYELSDNLKVLYLKVLCNYSYLNNNIIDADEYNAISSFSVRMEIGAAARKELRDYMNAIDQRQKTGYLMKEIKTQIGNEVGQWDALRYSLLQDVLYIHNLHDINQPWQQDGFVGSLMQGCDLKSPQMDTMLHAIDLNQKMQLKGADLKELKKEWKQFIKDIRFSDEYVPAMYLFCSGSIYGIANYGGFMKKDETSEKAINKQRELILHEIIENNQKTINVLVDDMNYIAEKLEMEVGEGEQLKENYQVLLTRLRRAMGYLNASKEDKEKEFTEGNGEKEV